ncbi:MAG: hypothetical protein ACRYFS_00580 [Janthinobacterium lividum]
MTGLNEYLQWYYLIYLLPGGVALFLLLISALGGKMHHGGTSHGHHGLGHSHHGSGQQTHQAASAARTPFLSAFFGLGRVPAPLVWGSTFLGWGVFGCWGTQFWQSLLHLPAAFVLPALATALAGAFVTEKVTVEAASRFLPGDETFAVSSVDLCGLTGTVAFPVDIKRGRVHVFDTHGTMHDVSARTAPGQGTIARGRTILVTDYDLARDQVIVEEAV